MKKIPVGATVAHAWRFAFGDFFKILGVMWLPLAIAWLPGIFMRQRMMEVSAQITARSFSGLGAAMWFLVPFYLAVMILLFMQIIGIAKLALGRRSGPVWFYFSLDKPVWRLIGSFLLLILACILGWLAVLLGDFLAGFLLRSLIGTIDNKAVKAILGFLTIIALIAPWCAYFYCAIRLTFLLTPVVAAEEDGFALARSWTLGLGNFWRMLAILLVIFVPFLVLEFALLFGYMFKGISFPPPHAPAAQISAYQAAMNARALEMMSAMYHYWYISYPLAIIFVVLFYGMGVGAQAFAYRALTDDEASAPVAAD
jgi:hypothetical protein